MGEQERGSGGADSEEKLLRAREDLIHERQDDKFLINDPIKNTFTSFGVAEYLVFRHFDGKSSLQEIIDRLKTERDVTVKMAEIERLARRLHETQLLVAEGEIVSASSGIAAGTGVLARLIMIDLGLEFNPDQALTRLYHSTKRIFFRPAFFITFFLLGILATTTAMVSWTEILRQVEATRPSLGTVVRFYIVLSLSLCVHELGHALATKGFGGKVPRMGAFLYYFMSVYYTDVSSSYLFTSKFRKLMVILAGPMVTSMLLFGSTLVWRLTIPGSPVNEWAFTFMNVNAFAAAVTLTPFVRGDGYYIVCTMLDISGLTEKARAYVLALVKRKILRQQVVVPEASDKEGIVYLIWAPVQFLFLLVFFFVLASRLLVFAIGTFQLIGFLLLVWAFMDRTGWPFLRWVPPLLSSTAELMRLGWSQGWRAFGRQLLAPIFDLAGFLKKAVPRLLLVSTPIVLLGFIPYTEHVSVPFTVVSESTASVRSPIDGVVESYSVETGQWVQKGDVVAHLDSTEARNAKRTAQAALDNARADLKLMRAGSRSEAIAVGREARHGARESLAYARRLLKRERGLQEAEATSQKAMDQRETQVTKAASRLGAAQSRLDLLSAGERPEKIEIAEARLALQELRLAQIQQQLDWSEVRALSDGFVNTTEPVRNSRIGRHFKRGDSILEITDPAQMVARMDVPERYGDVLAPGLPIRLRAVQKPQRAIHTHVDRIGRAVLASDTHSSGTLGVISRLAPAAVVWPVGTSGVAKFNVGREPIYRILERRVVRSLYVKFWAWW